MAKTRQWIVLPDIHHPEVCWPAFYAVLDYCKKNASKIEGVVLLGDNMDCTNISRHTKGKPRLRTRGGLQKDFEAFNREILEPLEVVVSKGVKKVFHLGNHEDWLEQWLDENPEFEGMFGFDKTLHLTERGWKVVPLGEPSKVGKAYLIHGDQVGSSDYVAKKMVDAYASTCIMGHVHRFSAHTRTSRAKSKDKWIGITLPTLGTLNPKYAKGSPNSFLNGFGIIELWPNGFVNIYVPIIFEGRFMYGGEVYGE